MKTTLIYLITATLCLSLLSPLLSPQVKASEANPQTVYETDELNSQKALYELAQKQDDQNITDVTIAGEQIPLDLVDSDSVIKTNDGKKTEDLSVSNATEVLLMEKTSDDNFSAFMTSTVFVEGNVDSELSADLVAKKPESKSQTDDIKVDNTSTYKNIGSNLVEKLSSNHKKIIFPTLVAKWTNSKSSQQYDGGRNVLLTIKIYYHYQKKGDANHVDMNYVEYWATPKTKGSMVSYRKLEFKQMGISRFKGGIIKNAHSSYPKNNHATVDVPDSWVPISTANGFVGAKLQADIYNPKGKKYSVSTTTMILDNLGVNAGRGSW
ncbi:hypothetical protein HCJ13_10605 [Listeria booriae]|uniref:Uncharacterized protein n=1 Tax=Listeria booriae TaxID=1552123 RepID=A0A7X1A8I3_9LIST|nr:hypothetical protein [Listeria booriae]MBC1650640.1 hypothetical protein [Listeria booriae]MBC2373130.1 hypothetical protein [Listeria booriae]